MTDLLLPFIILALLAVIVIQAVERYFYGMQTQRQVHRLVTAVISKNLPEYTAAVRVEENKEEKKEDPDEVLLDQAPDDVFDKFIKRQANS